MVTTYDIAKYAGLNQSTVSRVLSGGAKVRSATAEKVWEACKALNYVPNVQARGLKTRRTMTLAIHMPQAASTFLADPFVPAFLSGVSREAARSGYSVILSYEDESDPQQNLLNLIKSRRADGLILTSPSEADPAIETLIDEGIPFVTGRYEGMKGEKMACVDVDNRHSGYQAGRFLLAKGYREIGLITESRENLTARDFQRGFHEAVGAKTDSRWIRQVPVTFESAYQATLELLALKKPPQAIVVNTALTVFAAVEAVRKRRSKTLILGIESPLFASLHPELPRIQSPVEELGTQMAAALVEILTIGHAGKRTKLLKNEIVDEDGTIFSEDSSL